MFEFYTAVAAACVFSSGYLFGTIIGVRGEEKRARTKIAIAENRAEYWHDEAEANARTAQGLRAERDRLFSELADRPVPRQRDAKGRFVK